jgi:hypothetical protein
MYLGGLLILVLPTGSIPRTCLGDIMAGLSSRKKSLNPPAILARVSHQAIFRDLNCQLRRKQSDEADLMMSPRAKQPKPNFLKVRVGDA